MRQPCLQCFRKHIGNAAVLIEEVLDGYAGYKHMVCGHLDQAAQEIRGYSFKLSLIVRAHRIKWQQNIEYGIPFEAMDSFVNDLELFDDLSESNFPEIPEGCYEGLDKLASGEGYNLMLGDMRSMK